MPVATDYVQISARLQPELKKRGESALADAGYTPTAAVRKVFSFAAEHIEQPQAIVEYLEGGPAPKKGVGNAERNARLVAHRKAEKLVEEFFASLGDGHFSLPEGADEDLRGPGFEERFGEDWWLA